MAASKRNPLLAAHNDAGPTLANNLATSSPSSSQQHESATASSKAPGSNRSGQRATFTRTSSIRPPILTKRYRLTDSNELDKTTAAAMIEGRAERLSVGSLLELAETLRELKPHQALIYGVAEQPSVGLITEKDWERRERPEGFIPRTTEHFAWPVGPGVLLLDP
jgi:hypothetical protein